MTRLLLALSLAILLPSVVEAAEGSRVLHVDSYHRGNEWNDRIADAVVATLEDAGVEVRVVHMDTKRNPSEAFKRQAALEVVGVIEAWQPDVVTTSDDNAAKYLIAEHYKDAALPFVFCGLNWDAATYGLPFSNTTGMVEVTPIPQIIRLLRDYADGERIGYLTEDTPTKRKELANHEKLFGITYDRTYFVSDFAGWQDAYRLAQDEVDMLVLLGVAAVEDFDDEAAAELAESVTRIPTGTDFAWLMHFSMLGVGKLPEEQGEWAAKAALAIIGGAEPRQIPLAYNKEGKLYFNPKIAARLGVTEFPPLAELVN
jgi:ABC-type uncharacterized transport system substrate-binding protein